MAGSVNKVILVGNLGADPEMRKSNAGDPIANFRLATSETWRDKQSGDRREKTEWHNIVVFNDGLAKLAEQYLRKGMKVYIEGALQTRKWEKDGVERYTTEIVLQKFRGEIQMLDKKDDGDGDSQGRSSGSSRSSGGGGSSSSRGDNRGSRDGGGSNQSSSGQSQRDLDDEIPF